MVEGMFHTFQATTAPPEPVEVESGRKSYKRISTTNACVECRRRKIRCDGNTPCGRCAFYQQPQRCTYAKPTQRVVPSKKALDKLQHEVEIYHAIVDRMFPGRDLNTLLALPREQLVDLAVTLPAPRRPSSIPPETGLDPGTSHTGTWSSEDAESLDALEQAPERDPEIDEAKRHRHKVNAISDDVNGLSLSVDKQSSYVGISSISAALKVIFKTAPIAGPYIAQTYNQTVPPSRSTTPPLNPRILDPHYLPSPDVGHKLIESYFNHVHVQMPMIDEDHFWRTYLYDDRHDPPWLALLNMVMALGSLAGSTCDNEEHYAYFQRARRHLDLETFGSGNLLMLQAMGLLSGYYLHYLNRPNEANSLMGATLRMATALGLHREYDVSLSSGPSSQGGRSDNREVPAGIRRRTWWTLFCLDTWGNVATGRPSLGRMGPGVTVGSPKIPEQMNNAQYIASLRLLPIIHNIEFCKLATRIQDSLAARPLCKFEDLFAFDAELVKWHDELPPILRDSYLSGLATQRKNSASEGMQPVQTTPAPAHSSRRTPFDFAQPPDSDYVACPDILKTPVAVMHWRYQNLRMLMHRPYLLAAALRRTRFAGMGAEQKIAVTRCRVIAGQTIADIDATCRLELIAGWAAVWEMHQAVMVPLVSLFSHISLSTKNDDAENSSESSLFSGATDEEVEKWKWQIETALQFFDKMRSYSVAAKKSKDVVERLYEASKHVQRHREQQTQPPRPAQCALDDVAQASDTTLAHSNDLPSAYPADFGQLVAFEEPLLPSPDNDAAMESFWDDMLWGTFPETGDWMQGLHQFDWPAAD
ncbi:uncharacterized protein LTR77_010924 [Saxophila tyrrhenica]|uniref:Zn(2)-C6 fungal-type domain-containing protein n=1 Tax=Saxophila tyrrhenica TaxID=1690608 RepID=A0AAV9NXX4_9PEZI|nr:hypothetical protein LTR77_010924 [Saxophila tyrrhenica]